ncbi:MAG: ribosome silencing factor [Deltaproteobacteria bacterium]|nr:ribosome silencing factor [Deltaproteobacteria bacterium]
MSAKDPTPTLDPSTMTVEDVTRFAAQALWDKQAREIQILDVEQLVGYTDFLIIASARNERHVQALSNHLERQMRDLKLRSLSRDPVRNRRWVVSDYGDFVVHIFVVEERELYDLEGLWHEADRLSFIPKGAPAPRLGGGLAVASDEE